MFCHFIIVMILCYTFSNIFVFSYSVYPVSLRRRQTQFLIKIMEKLAVLFLRFYVRLNAGDNCKFTFPICGDASPPRRSIDRT